MRQAVMTKPAEIELRDVPVPAPKDNEILIQVKRIGVCDSDIHVYHGRHPYTSYPVVQGHEVSGVVTKVGRHVKGFRTGEKVTFLPQVTCGACYPCTHGMVNICTSLKVMGFQTSGAAQDFFAVPESLAVHLDDSVSFELGAMVEPLAVAVHALSRAGEIAGKRLVVLGAGTIGNLVGQTAKGLGAAEVMIADLSDYRLELAKKCSIDCAINTKKESLADAINAHYGEAKADAILECIGAEETMSLAVENARKGSAIVVVGVFGKKPQVDLGLVQDRELSLHGTLMYQRRDYETAIRLLREKKVDCERLITNRFRLEEYLKAYSYIDNAKDRAMKVMITLD